MYFGSKTNFPSEKRAHMQTDCGGAVITESVMTYGQADELAKNTDLGALHSYITSGWNNLRFPSCYWKPVGETVYIGELWWVIYSYLAWNKIIEGDWKSYNNSMEYLYEKIRERLELFGFVYPEQEGRYFRIKGL